MEITFKIDPSYASPDQVVRLITAMQGLAAAMGGTVAGGGAVGVGTVGSSASSGGVALCAEIPAKRVQQMLNTVFGSFEAQVSAAAPRLPSDAAIAKTSQNIDAAALSCTGPEEQRLFEMGIFQRVCSHAFSPVTSDSVLAWIEICSRIGIEALHETIRNQLTQRVLKTMTNPKKAMVASGADQSKIFLQPAICFAAMIKFSMIKMDGTCDTIAALLQADKTAAQAVLVLTEALRLCPDAFYRRASDEKINKLLGALTCTAATRVRGANDVHTQLISGRMSASGRRVLAAGGGARGGAPTGGEDFAAFDVSRPHTLLHTSSFAPGKRIHALTVLDDQLFTCGAEGTVSVWDIQPLSSTFGVKSHSVDISGGDDHTPAMIAPIYNSGRIVVSTFGKPPGQRVLPQTREPARSRVVDLCSSSASGQNTPRWSMVSERDSLERINALASDVESGGTCYITACTNPQTKVNSVNLFDAQRTGRATPVAKMEEHTKGLMRVAVRDGTDSCLVASGDKAGIVKLWDPRASAASFKTLKVSSTGKAISTVQLYNGLLMTASLDNVVKLYDVRMIHDKPRWSIDTQDSVLRALIHPSQRTIAISNKQGLAVIDIERKRMVKAVSKQKHKVLMDMAWAKNGNTLFAGGLGGTVSVWTLRNMES